MTGSNASAPSGPPFSEAQIKEVYSHIERVVSSSWFRTSPRCSTLLRYTVVAVLQGRTGQLHERQIGVEAFHRRPAYDSDADPVVRIAAGDVRKRLAQYYSDPESACQIRIDLPIGSYVPTFYFRSGEEKTVEPPVLELPALVPVKQANAEDAAPAVGSEPPSVLSLQAPLSRRWVKTAIAAALALLLIAGGVWLALRPPRQVSGIDAFWTPVFLAQQRALICIGEVFDQKIETIPNGNRSRFSARWTMDFSKQYPQGVPGIVYNDSISTARIAECLGKRGKDFDVLGQSRASFTDLLNRPVILIGSYNNDWTIHFTDAMRFRFESDMTQRLSWISDRERPLEKFGVLSNASADPANYEAYAVVARTADPAIGKPLVIVAGVTSVGALAATEFVTDPTYLNDFARHAPRDWNRNNIEILLATSVVENVPGRPRVIAYSLW